MTSLPWTTSIVVWDNQTIWWRFFDLKWSFKFIVSSTWWWPKSNFQLHFLFIFILSILDPPLKRNSTNYLSCPLKFNEILQNLSALRERQVTTRYEVLINSSFPAIVILWNSGRPLKLDIQLWWKLLPFIRTFNFWNLASASLSGFLSGWNCSASTLYSAWICSACGIQ